MTLINVLISICCVFKSGGQTLISFPDTVCIISSGQLNQFSCQYIYDQLANIIPDLSIKGKKERHFNHMIQGSAGPSFILLHRDLQFSQHSLLKVFFTMQF